MTESHPHNPSLHPEAALAAWLLPGLGHIWLGQKRRGLIIMTAILSLWLAGLTIGGITVIDRAQQISTRQQKISLWFIGQSMMAPSVAVEQIHHRLKISAVQKNGELPQPYDKPKPLYVPAIGRAAEIATLYTALAGMLNLLAILDIIYCDPKSKRHNTTQTPGAATP